MSCAKVRQERRRLDYRQPIDISETERVKRHQHSLDLRNAKREDRLKKRRNITSPHAPLQTRGFNRTSERVQEVEKLVIGVNGKERSRQLEATTQFRKLLSIEQNPPIQDVIDAKVVPRFVEFLKADDVPLLQFEAAWALTNIASGSSEQTRLVIEAGAVPLFKDLLSSPNSDVREQAVWALGNIAGDSPHCRDFVLSSQVIDQLIKILNESTEAKSISMLRNATWTLSNLCRGKPSPPWSLVSAALPALANLIHCNDDEVLTDACWALSYLSDGPNERIQAVINAGVHKQMVELLLNKLYTIQTPALRTVGNIVTGDDSQTQLMIEAKVLPPLLKLLKSNKKGIRKEACWTISNITAGNKDQISACISAGIMPHLIELLKTLDFDVMKEAAWAISNATSGGNAEQIRYLVNLQVIEPMCGLLSCSDTRIVLVALEGLENILKVGEKDARQTGINMYTVMLEECKGLDIIEDLQNHQNIEIYEKALNILEMYFAAEENSDEDAENDEEEYNDNCFAPPSVPQFELSSIGGDAPRP